MRKLKLQVQMSADGYIAGTNGEMDWLVRDWDDELKKYVTAITEPIDCIVLGRKLAQGFIPYWATVATNPDDPQFTAGQKFTDTYKVVFTKTLDKSDWANTVLAKGDLVDEITKLKKNRLVKTSSLMAVRPLYRRSSNTDRLTSFIYSLIQLQQGTA